MLITKTTLSATCLDGHTKNLQRGVGMLEILVAILLIATGYLAVARMQVESMHFSQSAYNRSQGYLMANDIIDRMRSNMQGVLGGYYDNQTTDETYISPNCTSSYCSPQQMAQLDLSQWRELLYPEDDAVPVLPSGSEATASGTITARGNSQYTVNIVWEEDGDAQSLNVSFVAQSSDSI